MKEATKIQRGEVVDYTATGAVANGDVIPLVDRVGVANDDAVSGDVISVELVGVFEMTAKTANAISFGAKVYFDDGAREITTTNTFTPAGIAVTTKAAATTGTVNVKIG